MARRAAGGEYVNVLYIARFVLLIHCRRSRARTLPPFLFFLIFIAFVDVNVCTHTYVRVLQ
jgi:hypothetical protein